MCSWSHACLACERVAAVSIANAVHSFISGGMHGTFGVVCEFASVTAYG